MMRAGLPIVEAMILVSSQTSNANMKRVTNEMVAKLNSGSSLSQAFKEHKRYFDSVYLNMVEAGEISGKLDVFLDRLVEMLEKQQAIKAGIKSAMFYPVTLVVITVGISYFMLTNVVPTFQDMYEGLGAKLPGPTQAIVDASNWIQDGGNLLGVISVVGGIWATNKTLHRFLRPYRKLKSIIALRLPLVGDIIVKATVARMSLLMADLLAAGVSVIDTLEVAKTVSTNVQFLDATSRITNKITTGAPLSALFGNEKVFPIALSQLMAVGERTGNMDEMLSSIAKYYEEEFTAVVDGLSTIIEPLMIVFVGLMIGLMVVALYLPIFSAGTPSDDRPDRRPVATPDGPQSSCDPAAVAMLSAALSDLGGIDSRRAMPASTATPSFARSRVIPISPNAWSLSTSRSQPRDVWPVALAAPVYGGAAAEYRFRRTHGHRRRYPDVGTGSLQRRGHREPWRFPGRRAFRQAAGWRCASWRDAVLHAIGDGRVADFRRQRERALSSGVGFGDR